MYQGSLRVSDPSVFDLAKRIGLDGRGMLLPRAPNVPPPGSSNAHWRASQGLARQASDVWSG